MSTSASGSRNPSGPAPVAKLDFWQRGRLRRHLREHPVTADVLLTGGYLLVGLPHVLHESRSGDWAAEAILVASAVAIMCRRRAPVLVLVAVTAGELLDSLTSSTGGNPTATWIALYTVALERPGRIALTLAALASASVFALRASDIPRELAEGITTGRLPAYSGVASASVFLLCNLFATGIGIAVRQGRKRVADLQRWAADQALLAAADERARIAREMHDIVAHSLSVVIALADGAAAALDRDPATARHALGQLSATGRSALSDMRQLLGILRTPDGVPLQYDPLGDEAALWPLVDRYRAAGLPVQYSRSGPPLPKNQPLQLAVFRIVQEALTNALRHAQDSTLVEARIASSGPTITISVTDNGHSRHDTRSSPVGGRGIAGIRERAALYGGTVTAGPGPAGGWTLEASLPVPEPDK